MDYAAWTVPPAAVSGVPVACFGASPSDSTVLMWRTSGLPVMLPLAAFSPTAQADFALIPELLPLDRRVAVLLADERRAPAFALALRDPRPLGAQGRLEVELATWAAREQARLGLPATRGPVLVVGDDARGTVAAEVRAALDDVRVLLACLPWPRWAGPVVLYVDAVERGIPMPAGIVVRPALPLIQFMPMPGQRPAFASQREPAAAHLARLALNLTAPPARGWPAWLLAGVAEVARAKAAGEGPSPKAMRERRAAAGPAVIAALLASAAPEAISGANPEAPAVDAKLSAALVQPLLTPNGQTHFISFLDLLRQGASSTGALRIAYGITPATW